MNTKLKDVLFLEEMVDAIAEKLEIDTGTCSRFKFDDAVKAAAAVMEKYRTKLVARLERAAAEERAMEETARLRVLMYDDSERHYRDGRGSGFKGAAEIVKVFRAVEES